LEEDQPNSYAKFAGHEVTMEAESQQFSTRIGFWSTWPLSKWVSHLKMASHQWRQC